MNEATDQTIWVVDTDEYIVVGCRETITDKREGIRAIRIPISSGAQSGARVEVLCVDADGNAVGRGETISIDWTGDNDLQLWLRRLRIEAPEVRRVEGVKLSRQKAGIWPTRLTVGKAEFLRSDPTWRVDGPDTVIEMGWHYAATAVDAWKVAVAPTTVEGGCFVMSPERRETAVEKEDEYGGGLEYRGTAPWLTFGYRRERAPRTMVVYRDFDLDIREFRSILFKATWDIDTLLSAEAETDSGTIALCNDRTPVDDFTCLGADLVGERLQRIRFILRERSDATADQRDVALGLFWILLREPSSLDDLPHNEVVARHFGIWDRLDDDPKVTAVSVPMPPFNEPQESMTPIGDPIREGLPFGFYASRHNLEALREKCLHEPSKEMFSAIQREADRAIATELTDRNTYGNAQPWGGVGKPKGYRGAGMKVFAPLTAFVHLITGESKYAVACRRWILRAAASDRWIAEHGGPSDIPRMGEEMFYDDIFTGTHPKGFWGYMDHHFFVADAAYGIAAAYDMLYHCFDESEREAVENAMAKHGLFYLWDKMLHGWDFYVMMNQGVLIALPLLMQTAFLKDRSSEHRYLYEKSVDFLVEFSSRPWNEEGVMGEGPGYGSGTFIELIETLPVLTACTGKPIESFLPPDPDVILDYLCHCRSTWRTPGRWPHFVGLSDGGEYGWIGSELLVFFARFRRNGVAEYLLRELDEPPHPTVSNILFDGSSPEPIPPVLSTSHIYRDQPMVFFRTGTQEGDSQVLMNAIKQVTCHGHLDRGTIIFEFAGEALVADPGMVGYNDTRARQYQKTMYHNCLTIGENDQLGGYDRYDVEILACEPLDRGPEPFADAKVGTVSRATQETSPRAAPDTTPGDPYGINWAIVDLTAVYAEAESYVRHLIFLRPATVALFDEIILSEPAAVTLNFNLLGEISREGEMVRATSPHTVLTIAAKLDGGYSFTTSELGTHWPDLQTHRLMLTSNRVDRRHGWLTVLSAKPKDLGHLLNLGRSYFELPEWRRFGTDVSATSDGAEPCVTVQTSRGEERFRFSRNNRDDRRTNCNYDGVVERMDHDEIVSRVTFRDGGFV